MTISNVKRSAYEARDSVKNMKGSPIIFHFNDKIVQELARRKLTKERIAVNVNCVGKNTPLEIPLCISSTGDWQTKVITDFLKSYELKEEIFGMVSDTTPSNTGTNKGV